MFLRKGIYVSILCGSILANFALCCVFLKSVSSRTELKSFVQFIGGKVGVKDSTAILLRHSPIICLGDSLTAGAGASFGRSYPRILQSITGGDIFNEGVGSETSTQIKNRFVPISRNYGRSLVIIWAGRNNLENEEAVEADIGAIVSSLPRDSMYLVIGIINGGFPNEYRNQVNYKHIISINAHLSSVYRDRYVAIREYLVSRYDNERSNDIRDHERDIVPTSLRSDQVHLNNNGYALVATYLFDHWLVRE